MADIVDNSTVLLVYLALVAIGAAIGFFLFWIVRPRVSRKIYDWKPGRYHWVFWLVFGIFWTWAGTREMELSGLAMAHSGTGGIWIGFALSDLVILRRNKSSRTD